MPITVLFAAIATLLVSLVVLTIIAIGWRSMSMGPHDRSDAREVIDQLTGVLRILLGRK